MLDIIIFDYIISKAKLWNKYTHRSNIIYETASASSHMCEYTQTNLRNLIELLDQLKELKIKDDHIAHDVRELCKLCIPFLFPDDPNNNLNFLYKAITVINNLIKNNKLISNRINQNVLKDFEKVPDIFHPALNLHVSVLSNVEVLLSNVINYLGFGPNILKGNQVRKNNNGKLCVNYNSHNVHEWELFGMFDRGAMHNMQHFYPDFRDKNHLNFRYRALSYGVKCTYFPFMYEDERQLLLQNKYPNVGLYENLSLDSFFKFLFQKKWMIEDAIDADRISTIIDFKKKFIHHDMRYILVNMIDEAVRYIVTLSYKQKQAESEFGPYSLYHPENVNREAIASFTVRLMEIARILLDNPLLTQTEKNIITTFSLKWETLFTSLNNNILYDQLFDYITAYNMNDLKEFMTLHGYVFDEDLKSIAKFRFQQYFSITVDLLRIAYIQNKEEDETFKQFAQRVDFTQPVDNLINALIKHGITPHIDTPVSDENYFHLFRILKFNSLVYYDNATRVPEDDDTIVTYFDSFMRLKPMEPNYRNSLLERGYKLFVKRIVAANTVNKIPEGESPLNLDLRKTQSMDQLRLFLDIRATPQLDKKDHQTQSIKRFFLARTVPEFPASDAEVRFTNFLLNSFMGNLNQSFDKKELTRFTYMASQHNVPDSINDLTYSYLKYIINGASLTELSQFINNILPDLAPHMGLHHIDVTKDIIEKYFNLLSEKRNEQIIKLCDKIRIATNIQFALPHILHNYSIILHKQQLKNNTYIKYIKLKLNQPYDILLPIFFRNRKILQTVIDEEDRRSSLISVKKLISNCYVDTAYDLYKKLYINNEFITMAIEPLFNRIDDIDLFHFIYNYLGLFELNESKEMKFNLDLENEVKLMILQEQIFDAKQKDYIFQNIINFVTKFNIPFTFNITHYNLNIIRGYVNMLNSSIIRPMINSFIQGCVNDFTLILNDIQRGFNSTQNMRNRQPRFLVDRVGSVTQNQLQHSNNLLYKSQLQKKDFSQALHPITHKPITTVIPYKSIEFLRILSFNGKRRIEGHQFRPQPFMNKYTYFNINGLDFNRINSTLFYDLINDPFTFRLLVNTPSRIRNAITKQYIHAYACMQPALYEEDGFYDSTFLKTWKQLQSSRYAKRYIQIELPEVLEFLTFWNKKKPKINAIDAKIYKILKNQNLDPECKSVILQALYQIKQYNNFYKLMSKKIVFSGDDHALFNFHAGIVDKFPYIGSPLRHLAGNVKLTINDGLTYTFRLIGLKDNLTQLTVFTNNSYISLLHFINTNYHKESLWVLPDQFIKKSKYLLYKKPKLIIRYEKPKTMFGQRFLLKKRENHEPLYTEPELFVVETQTVIQNENHDHIFLIEEYKHNPHYHGLYIIVGDDKPLQKFTQLSSYKEFMNPELRSLLQFDFGYMKIDYNNFLKENFFNRKFILNINYKINIDKSFSDSPKLELVLDKNHWAINQTRNYLFSDFFKKSEYFLTPYGAFVKYSLRRYLSHTHKFKELISNSNILKQTYLSKENNIYDNTQTSPLKVSFNLIKDTDKVMKLSASWVKMYRAREFAKNLNANIYEQLQSYNLVGTIYAAPFKKLNPLEPLKFRSQYRYTMYHRLSERWPSLINGYFYPKFVSESIKNRLSKIFEHYDIRRSYSKKHLDFFFFNRDLKNNWNFFEKESEFCFNVNYEPKLITSILPKKNNSKKLKKTVIKEIDSFYSNIQKCFNNIIKNPAKEFGYSFHTFGTNYRVPISRFITVLKNNVYELAESSTPYNKIIKYINGYKACKGTVILTDAFDIQVTDKDPRKLMLLINSLMPRYFLFHKQLGIPIMHPNIRAPYQVYHRRLNKNRQTFKFDVVIMPQNISKSYTHRRYTNIFSHYILSRANNVRLKPIIIATPNEQFEFSKGNILTLFKSTIFKHSSLLNTNQPGNYYSTFFNSKLYYTDLSNYILNLFRKFESIKSSYTMRNPIKTLVSECVSDSKYWNSDIIAWRIQQNTLYSQIYTPFYRRRTNMFIKRLSRSPNPLNSEAMRRAGARTRFEADIFNRGLIVNVPCKYNTKRHFRDKLLISSKKIFAQFDKFNIYTNLKINQQFHKLKLIKRSRGFYTSSKLEQIEFIKYFKKLNDKLLEWKLSQTKRKRQRVHKIFDLNGLQRSARRPNKGRKKKIERFHVEPFVGRLRNRTVFKNIQNEGLDWKLFRKSSKLLPLPNDKHLNPLYINLIKKVDEARSVKLPQLNGKSNKLIIVKKKNVPTVAQQHKLSELHETISDLLKNDTFSWITFHEYREELMRNQTTSIPGGIISSLITTFGLGSILTFILLAADYHRAPNKIGASRLVSWKVFIILLLCSFLVYITIDITGYDIFTELLKSSESPVGIQKVPQHVILPHQVNHTIDDFDKNTFRTPFFTKKESTWHYRRLVAVFDFIFTKGTKKFLEITPDYIPEPDFKDFAKMVKAEDNATIFKSKFNKPFNFE